MAATTLGFIPLQLIQTNAMPHYNFDKGFPTNGTYVVVKTPTVAQQLQLTKSLKEMQTGKEVNNNEPSKPVILRCKRRVDFTGLGCKLVDSHNPSVSRRNERERKRVKMVNMGFETLRQHVPSGRKNKKMSKVETLRSAVQYIKQLQDMLNAADGDSDDMEKIDMSELESKVSELIQSAANEMNMDTSSVADAFNNNVVMPDLHNQQQNHQSLQQQDQLQAQLQQQHSPASSQGLPHSPVQQQQQQQHAEQQQQHQFYQTYTHSSMFADQYDNVSSDYSQASPAGSLHSPTSSVVSDSSYDSVGDSATPDDDDILSGFTNWF